MFFLFLFFFELFLLSFFSRTLMNSLARWLIKIFRNKKAAFIFLAVIFLPGTIVHELSHLITAGLLRVPAGKIEILPEIEGNEVKFGSVGIAQTDLARRFLIGIAPVVFGLSVISTAILISINMFSDQMLWWQIALVLYFIFVVANTMFASQKDMEGSMVLYLVLILILFIFISAFYLTGNLDQIVSWTVKLDLKIVNSFFQRLAGIMLIPIGLDFTLIAIARIFRV